MIPIVIPKKELRFLEISTKRAISKALKINCTHREQEIYIKDKYNDYWKYSLSEGFTKTKLDSKFTSKDRLVKLASYNERLLHYSKAQPHRTTLLRILDTQQDAIQEISDIRERGRGSLAQGIARSMSDIFQSLERTGENVFDLVARGVVSIANDTVSVTKGTTSLITSLFSITGGISNFLLYIINLGIIIYLTYKHIAKCRNIRHKRYITEMHYPITGGQEIEHRTTDLEDLPPPIPVRCPDHTGMKE